MFTIICSSWEKNDCKNVLIPRNTPSGRLQTTRGTVPSHGEKRKILLSQSYDAMVDADITYFNFAIFIWRVQSFNNRQI